MNNNNNNYTRVLVGLLLCLIPSFAFATGTTVMPGNILAQYQTFETQWANNAASIGTALYGTFAAIEFAWTWISWLLEKGGGDGESVIPTLLKKIIQLCFGLWLVQNAVNGLDLIGTLMQGFEWLGVHIGGVSFSQLSSTGTGGLSPSGIFNQGMQIAGDLESAALKQLGVTDIGQDIMIVFVVIPSVLAIALIYALIAVTLIMTLVEMYVVIGAGAIFLAFLGSRWTQSFGEKFISQAVSVGVKLFVFTLIIAAGQHLGAMWLTSAQNASSDLMNYVGIAASVIIFGMLAMKIPSMAASMISGSSGFLGGGDVIGTAAAVAAAGVAAAATGGMAAAGLGGAALNAAGGAAGIKSALGGAAGKLADMGSSAMSGLAGLAGGGAAPSAPGLGDMAGALSGAGGVAAAEMAGGAGAGAAEALGSAGGAGAGSGAQAADAANGAQQADSSNPNAGNTDAGEVGQTANDAGNAETGSNSPTTPSESGTPASAADAANGAQQADTSNPNAGNTDAGNVGQTANDAGNTGAGNTAPETPLPTSLACESTQAPTRSNFARAMSGARAAGQGLGKAAKTGHNIGQAVKGAGDQLAEQLDGAHMAGSPISIKLHD
jgi:type IV secretion system protein TrbL